MTRKKPLTLGEISRAQEAPTEPPTEAPKPPSKRKSAVKNPPAEPAPAPAKLSFVELAHKTARDEKITLAAAYSRVAREHADLYDEHLQSAPVAKRIR